MDLTRRRMLAGLLAGGAGMAQSAALAGAPTLTSRPRPRPEAGEVPRVSSPAGDRLVDRARLGENAAVSFAVADAATGQMLEARSPLLPQPPASTAKTLTTVYALGNLGPSHRFHTRLLATGPVTDGRIKGDLVLAGGGDPTLDTDTLGGLAKAMKDAGVTGVDGRFVVWAGALPLIHEIDAEQPDHVAYNPGLSGLNLNYNRVHFEWERQGGRYDVTMDSPGIRFSPAVEGATMEVVDRRLPVYTYEQAGTRDAWTVARGALGSGGSRWLPVRRPDLYAAEVFAKIARSYGIELSAPELTRQPPGGTELARVDSAPLVDVLKEMLKYSTNPTAELVGLSTSAARGAAPPNLAASAAAMNDWLGLTHGLESCAMEDHSGLGDDSRVTAADMVRLMVSSGPDGPLPPILKDFPVWDAPELKVAAKTGTLNFVSCLTGFLTPPGGAKPLAFAIFCTDVTRRDALPMELRERPPGGREWLGRARALQRELLKRWSTVHRA